MNSQESFYIKNQVVVLSLFFLLLTFSRYNLYIGFSLKTYMMFLFLFVFFHLRIFYFQKLALYEVSLLLFYLIYCFSGTMAYYTGSSIRIVFGVILVISCFFIMRYMFMQYSLTIIEKGLGLAGIIFCLVSLILYVLGLFSFGFQLTGDGESAFGVLLDRNYPRLIGTLEDPNLYIFYCTIFIFYYLSNLSSALNKLGLFLCALTCVLTFSRGGLAALVIVFLIYIFMDIKRIKSALISVISIGFIGYLLILTFQFDVIEMLSDRIKDFKQDGGSGRFDLWSTAFSYFLEHPLFGIGAFNFSDYYLTNFGKKLYVHNTYLEILTESGLAGFSFFSIFLLLLFRFLIRSRMHNKQPFLFLTFLALGIQMLSLSLIINEMFFMYLALVYRYSFQEMR
ncbi:O-antigen ligase family protein [Bacillus timonensis]|nr:O-antigen ligase family protein [Bacillus timonensis]